MAQMDNPLDKLLRSRGAQQGTFTSQIAPAALQQNPFENVDKSSQLSGFYGQISAIGDRIREQKAAAEDSIYRQMQAKKEKALLAKIRASIPQALPTANLPNYGSSPNYSSPSPMPPVNRGGGGGGIKLPNINTPGSPVVAPPRVPVYVPGIGWHWI